LPSFVSLRQIAAESGYGLIVEAGLLSAISAPVFLFGAWSLTPNGLKIC